MLTRKDATTGGVLLEKVSPKVSQDSKTCNSLFLIKLQATGTVFFSVHFVKYKNTFFAENLRTTASKRRSLKKIMKNPLVF